MPPAKKASSQTAKKRANDPAIMCPLIKDHLMHVGQHLDLMVKARNLPPKERKDALGLQTIVRQAEDYIKVGKFFARPGDLPERR